MKLKIQTQAKQSGITLIEVMISMFFVVAIFVLFLAAMNTVALTKKLNYEDIAYHIANKQMETLRETAFTSLPASGSISDPLLSKLPSGSGSYTTTNYSAYSGMKEITVTVNWNVGGAKKIVIKTLAGSGGINP